MRVGDATDAGLPTLANVAGETALKSERTEGASGVVPGSVVPVPRLFPRREALMGEGPERPPDALMITIVAMAATTSNTGISAAKTGCRDRKVRRVAFAPLAVRAVPGSDLAARVIVPAVARFGSLAERFVVLPPELARDG
jgi:hypothetical protein